MSRSCLLVLLHGALMDRGSMLPLAPHLPEHFLLLCPDLACHGQRRSQSDPLGPLSPYALAVDLYDRLPLQRLAATLPLHLVGHSLGGLVALELQQLLHAGGGGAASLVLGDSPLCINLDTPSQHAAATAMAQDPVGPRLARDVFFEFAPTTRPPDPTAPTCSGCGKGRNKFQSTFSMDCYPSTSDRMAAGIVERFFQKSVSTTFAPSVPMSSSIRFGMRDILSFIVKQVWPGCAVALPPKSIEGRHHAPKCRLQVVGQAPLIAQFTR